MINKKCIKCNEIKSIDHYKKYLNRKKEVCHFNFCRDCYNLYEQNRRKNKTHIALCPVCNKERKVNHQVNRNITVGRSNGLCRKCSDKIGGSKNKIEFMHSSKNRVLRTYKNAAKSRGYNWDLSNDDFDKLSKQKCFYCGKQPSNIAKSTCNNGDFIYQGIDRLDNTKGYNINNCVPCCIKCNRAKDVDSFENHKEWIKNSYNTLFIKENNNG